MFREPEVVAAIVAGAALVVAALIQRTQNPDSSPPPLSPTQANIVVSPTQVLSVVNTINPQPIPPPQVVIVTQTLPTVIVLTNPPQPLSHSPPSPTNRAEPEVVRRDSLIPTVDRPRTLTSGTLGVVKKGIQKGILKDEHGNRLHLPVELQVGAQIRVAAVKSNRVAISSVDAGEPLGWLSYLEIDTYLDLKP